MLLVEVDVGLDGGLGDGRLDLHAPLLDLPLADLQLLLDDRDHGLAPADVVPRIEPVAVEPDPTPDRLAQAVRIIGSTSSYRVFEVQPLRRVGPTWS